MMSASVWDDLASYILEHRNAIVERFTALVRTDLKIQSAHNLPKEGIVDHMPELLTSFAEDLQQASHSSGLLAAQHKARAHSHIRWTQHYRLDEVLREFSVLRYVLMLQIADFEKQYAFDAVDRLIAERTLHSLMDELMIIAAGEFTSHSQRQDQREGCVGKTAKAFQRNGAG